MRLRECLFTLLSAVVMGGGVVLVAVGAGPGCQTRCFNQFDCGEGSYCFAGRCETECFTDQDCREPAECQGNPTACECRGFRCDSVGRCVGPCLSRPAGRTTSGPRSTLPDEVEGWTRQPGDGQAFIIDSLAIAPEGKGFNIDNTCRGDGDCNDNSLHELGNLGNDQIRQGLRSGETLLLVELAGLDPEYRGNGDESLTVKFYGARDADEPFFPADNFEPPPNSNTCCQFKINPQSVAGEPQQARARAPAQLSSIGELVSLLPVTIKFTLTVGLPPHTEITIKNVRISGRLAADLSKLTDGLIGGAIPINTLAQTENPYCKTLNSLCPRTLPDSTLIDLIAIILQPDTDLDLPPDGLEVLKVSARTGRITQCFDGCVGGCEGPIVGPLTPGNDHSCALRPEMADGYSVGLTFSGVKASVVGIGQ